MVSIFFIDCIDLDFTAFILIGSEAFKETLIDCFLVLKKQNVTFIATPKMYNTSTLYNNTMHKNATVSLFY